MATLIERRLFNREEYHAMARAGILTEDDPVELIDGEVVCHETSSPPEASCIIRLNRLFSQISSTCYLVSIHDPLGLGVFSEPDGSRYRVTEIFKGDDTIPIPALPGSTIAVGEFGL